MKSKKSFLYVHVPFCKKRCDYCSFYSSQNLNYKKDYIEAIQKETEILSSIYKDKLETIYFGGGSPSSLQINELSSIISTIKKCFETENLEFTFEVNPNEVDIEYASSLMDLGINRISIGFQSHSDRILKLIGRVGTYKDFEKAYFSLRTAGFKNISMDLMYGLPYQSLQDFEETLKLIKHFDPEHVSSYLLTVDKNTKLHKNIRNGKTPNIDEEIQDKQYEMMIDFFEKSEYVRYECSSFAKISKESRHNLAYWNYEDTLAIGPSAVYTYGGIRRKNFDSLKKYIDEIAKSNLPIMETEIIDKKESKFEAIIMGLRLKKGLNIKKLDLRFGGDFIKENKNWYDKFSKLGMLKLKDNMLYLDGRGVDLINLILTELIWEGVVDEKKYFYLVFFDNNKQFWF